MGNAVVMGEFIRTGFAAQLKGVAGVREIRNKGLMIGIELDYACDVLVKEALAAGLLINVTNDNVIRLLPPLVMQRDEAEQLVAILSPLIADFLARSQAAVPTAKTA
jgi:acetylornithine aminotransferase